MYLGYKSGRVQKIDEGLKLGDYPELPWQSAQELPARGWWDDQDRRNKEDPVCLMHFNTRCHLPCIQQLHEQDDILNMWVCDAVENNGRYTRQVLVRGGFPGCGICTSLLWCWWSCGI